jgi:hypothetical protein
MAATEMDLSPVEPECLSSASAGIEEEGHERSKMLAARGDQSVRFVERQPLSASLHLGTHYTTYRKSMYDPAERESSNQQEQTS